MRGFHKKLESDEELGQFDIGNVVELEEELMVSG